MTSQNGQKLVFRVITDCSELFRIAELWGALWASIQTATPFCAPDWILCWLETFWRDEWQLNVLAGFDGEELRVLVPVYIQPPQSFWGSTIAFPLGQGEEEIEEICTEYLEILVAPGHEEAARQPIVDWLRRLDVDGIRWHGLQSDLYTADLIEDVHCAKRRCRRRYLIDKDTWDKDKLGRNTRNRWNRAYNKLQKNTSHFEWTLGPDQESLWPTLAKYHQRRWNARGSSGAFHASRFSEFHEKFAARTKYESSCMSCLRINGELAAINYYIMDRDTLYFYQSGWDLDFADLSPGFTLHIWSIQNTDKRYYDFMAGDSTKSYKKQFRSLETEIIDSEIMFRPIRYNIKRVCTSMVRFN